MSQLAVWNYGTRTQWSFDGLLTAVDSKWKGLLFVVAVLFYRPIQELVARAPAIKTPLFGDIPLQPGPADQIPTPSASTGTKPAAGG